MFFSFACCHQSGSSKAESNEQAQSKGQETISGANQQNETPKVKYLYGVPPAPPYQKIDLTITEFLTEGCGKAEEPLVGYIIEVLEDLPFCYVGILVQDENGVRSKNYIDEPDNCTKSWLPSILIPGNKVKMELQLCGNYGFQHVMRIQSLERE